MIVVTAPTSRIGSQLVAKLLEAGEAVRVVARDPAKLPLQVRDRAEVVQGSHGDAAVVRRAFRGADAVFWLAPPDPRAKSSAEAYVDFSRPAAEAFRTEGTGHVVSVSSLGRHSAWREHAGLVTASLAMDDLIAGSGVNVRALAMPSFMDNLLRQIEGIRARGVFSDMLPGGLKTYHVATSDIAATAARLLTDRSWQGSGEVPVFDPEALSFDDMAQVMSETLGKPVRYEQVPDETVKAGLVGYGWSEAMVQAMLDMTAAIRDGGMYSSGLEASVLTAPTSFRQWCEHVLKPAMRG